MVSVGILNKAIVHQEKSLKQQSYQMLAVLCLFIIIQAVMLHHLNKVVSLYEAGQSLDIKVLDYLIIGDGCLVSLKEKGYL